MQDLDIDSPRGAAFLRRFFRNQAVEYVPRRGTMAPQQCYANVRQMVLQFGGEPVWGWALKQLNGRFAEAIHHAVWKNPAGDLVDVTPIMHDADIGQTVFVRDNSIPVSDHEPGIASKFKQFDKSKTVSDWIKYNVERMKLVKEYNDIIRRLPHRITPMGIKLDAAIPPRLIAARQKLDAIAVITSDIDRRMVSGVFN